MPDPGYQRRARPRRELGLRGLNGRGPARVVPGVGNVIGNPKRFDCSSIRPYVAIMNRRYLIEEVAVIARAPVSSVRYWIASGKLKSSRPGRRRLVTEVDLDRFLRGGTSAAERQSSAENVVANDPQHDCQK
jgi:excisionase family DNA binding protein